MNHPSPKPTTPGTPASPAASPPREPVQGWFVPRFLPPWTGLRLPVPRRARPPVVAARQGYGGPVAWSAPLDRTRSPRILPLTGPTTTVRRTMGPRPRCRLLHPLAFGARLPRLRHHLAPELGVGGQHAPIDHLVRPWGREDRDELLDELGRGQLEGGGAVRPRPLQAEHHRPVRALLQPRLGKGRPEHVAGETLQSTAGALRRSDLANDVGAGKAAAAASASSSTRNVVSVARRMRRSPEIQRNPRAVDARRSIARALPNGSVVCRNRCSVTSER